MSEVPLYLDILGKALDHKGALVRLGNLETKLLSYDLEAISITKPIFVCGLARAGTTIVLEALAAHNDVSSHQYKDYPFIHSHYLWSKLRKFVPPGREKVERAHRDGLMVNAQSPEAMDEVVWKSFSNNDRAAFELFYKNHIKKNLLLHGATRFVSKNNYNIARIHQLSSMFPDAKFIIPIRKPIEHVASLLKQHALFSEVHKNNLRSKRYTERLEHYEFGSGFLPVNIGDVDKVRECWALGDYLRAYAHYWRNLHDYIFQLRSLDNVHIIRYDDMCAGPDDIIAQLLTFCELHDGDAGVGRVVGGIESPHYYQPNFSSSDVEKILQITESAYKTLWHK